jgi:hypothetical protein
VLLDQPEPVPYPDERASKNKAGVAQKSVAERREPRADGRHLPVETSDAIGKVAFERPDPIDCLLPYLSTGVAGAGNLCILLPSATHFWRPSMVPMRPCAASVKACISPASADARVSLIADTGRDRTDHDDHDDEALRCPNAEPDVLVQPRSATRHARAPPSPL